MIFPKHLKKIFFSKAQLYIIGSQVFRGIIALVVMSYLARHLTPQNFALIAISMVLVPICFDLIDFGGCAFAVRELSAHRISLNNFFSQLIIKHNYLIPISIITGIVISYRMESLASGLVVSIFFYLCAISSYVQGYLVGNGELTRLSIIQFLERLSWISSIFLMNISISPIVAFYTSVILGQMTYFLYYLIKIKGPSRYLGFGSKKDVIKMKSKYFGFQSIISDLTLLDSFIVALVTSGTAGGVYAYAQKFRAPLALGFSAICMEIRSLSSTNLKVEINEMMKKSKTAITFNVAVIVALSLLSVFYAEKLIGTNYKNLNTTLSLVIFSTIFLGLISIQQTILIRIDFEQIATNLTVIFSLLLLSGISLGAYFLGSTGAAIIYLFITFVWYHVGKRLGEKYLFSTVSI